MTYWQFYTLNRMLIENLAAPVLQVTRKAITENPHAALSGHQRQSHTAEVDNHLDRTRRCIFIESWVISPTVHSPPRPSGPRLHHKISFILNLEMSCLVLPLPCAEAAVHPSLACRSYFLVAFRPTMAAGEATGLSAGCNLLFS
jgi:hypothetical protein